LGHVVSGLPAGALAQAGDLPFPSMEPGYQLSSRHDKKRKTSRRFETFGRF